MSQKTVMISTIQDAQRHPFHSFGDVDDSDVEGAVLHHQSDHCILLSVAEESRVHLYWACDSSIELQRVLQTYLEGSHHEPVYMEFIPASFSSSLESVGFAEHSEYIDHWLHDLRPVDKVHGRGDTDLRRAVPADFAAISSITRQCVDQSRGFTVETPESLMEWNSGTHNQIIVAFSGCQILGHALLSLYGFDSPKGTVLWLRELAVQPESQRQGIGKSILIHAMNWGCERGATRSFLHCDSKNVAAIRLYERYGYVRSNGGQLNMIYADGV
jgi:ribosomal protein S18 acetylase RimI-like enzyme